MHATDLQAPLLDPILEPILDLHVTVGAPIEAGHVHGLGAQGRRRIIPITGGSFSGKFNGRVLAAGADFQMLVSDTTADLDARYILALEGEFAGEHIYVTNRAVRKASVQDTARLAQGEPVDPAQVYFRCVPSFEVSSPKLAWLTQSVFVGTGARYPEGVSLRFYRVT